MLLAVPRRALRESTARGRTEELQALRRNNEEAGGGPKAGKRAGQGLEGREGLEGLEGLVFLFQRFFTHTHTICMEHGRCFLLRCFRSIPDQTQDDLPGRSKHMLLGLQVLTHV